MTTSLRESFRFFERLRVRWSEVDVQRIVFNAHYLTYLDTAMAGYWRALAVPYADAMHALGGDTFVRKAALEYEGPARLDDVLDIGMRCERIGNTSIVFEGAVFRGEERLVRGELVYVYADPATMKSAPVPEALRGLFLAFEDGQPMVELHVGRWAEWGEGAQALRQRVFVGELGISAEQEWDGLDEDAVHALVLNRLGMPVATGRLLPGPEAVRIGRLAVRAELRHEGLGARVLDALLAEARRLGASRATLHAHAGARSLYERAGFQVQGEPVVEAGRAHVRMARTL